MREKKVMLSDNKLLKTSTILEQLQDAKSAKSEESDSENVILDNAEDPFNYLNEESEQESSLSSQDSSNEGSLLF